MLAWRSDLPVQRQLTRFARSTAAKRVMHVFVQAAAKAVEQEQQL